MRWLPQNSNVISWLTQQLTGNALYTPRASNPHDLYSGRIIILSPRYAVSLLLLSVLVATASAQKPQPSPTPLEDDTPVKVFTEEVRLQVFAVDQFGHYDPSVVPDDILILEDGVAQQIKSVRHIPSN